MMFAKVCVDVVTGSDDLFTYAVPEIYRDYIYVGSRVFVEFGFQKTLAYVIELAAESDYDGPIKEIIEVIDFDRGLTEEQIALAREISNATKSSLSHCLRLMYPAFMQSRLRRFVKALRSESLPGHLQDLFKNRKRIPLTAEVMPYYKDIRAAAERGDLEIETDVYAYGKRKIIKTYRLASSEEPRGAKQKAVFGYLKTKDAATVEEIKENTGASDFVINLMAKRGILAMIPAYPPAEATKAKPVKITFDFDENQIREKFRRLSGKPFLFYADSEDFRLRFCLDAVSETIASGKKALILAPTMLAVTSLANYFRKGLSAARVCVFSSLLSESDFYYGFQNVIAGDVDLVITTLAGVFLPLSDIGLIIITDEDHHSYINQQTPKYSALEVLKYRADYHRAKLVLATSAPSVVSYYRYHQAEYFLLELIKKEKRRFALVNAREEPSDMLLTSALRREVEAVWAAGKTAALVLNNLGYSTANICDKCGELIKCPQCKIGLVYYKNKNHYHCRYCNQRFPAVRCENCEATSVRHLGYGLERLEERFRAYYPDRRLYKASSLTLQRAEDFENFILALEEGEIDAVIGTNILLDALSPEIGLIALINADALLYADDYRSAEMCYRLITKALDYRTAKTVIQGYNLDHRAITDALNNDYLSFYREEIITRGYATYPPYAELNKLTVSGEFKDIYYFANYFKKVFKRFKKGDCLGPVYLSKIRGVRLIIKHNDFPLVSSLIDEVEKKFSDRKLRVNFERYPRFYE